MTMQSARSPSKPASRVRCQPKCGCTTAAPSTSPHRPAFRCSDLLAHDGTVIHSQMVRFEPDTVPMPARCSRGVTVEVDVAEDLPPGCYRGTLLPDGHADVWLPVVLTVNPQLS